ALRIAMEDRSARVRVRAAGTLLGLGITDRAAIEILRRSLRSTSKSVRLDASWVLASAGWKACADLVPDLLRCLGDRNSDIACYAGEALSKLGAAAFGGLILVLEGEDLYAQYWAAQALSKAPGVSSAAKATLLNIVSRRDVYRRA